PSKHLSYDHLDVLVIDVDALQTIDLLNFVDQIALKFFDAANRKNVVRIQRSVHQRLSGSDPIVFLNVDVNTTRDRVLALLTVRTFNNDATESLENRAELHNAVDFSHHRSLTRLSSFKQLDHSRQTSGDVLCLCSLAGYLGDDVPGSDSQMLFLLLTLRSSGA